MGQDRQMQMIGGNGGNQFRQYTGQNTRNLNGYNAVQNVGNQVAQNLRVQNVRNQNGLIGVQGNGNQNQIGNGHFARDCTVRPRRRDAAYLQTQLLIAQKEEAGIQLQAEEYDLMTAVADLNEIEENDNNVISEVTNGEQGGETVEQHSANFEEMRALYESLYQNLAIEVEKKDSNYLIHSYRVVCFETFRYIADVAASFQRSQIHIIKLKGQIKVIHVQGDLTTLKCHIKAQNQESRSINN
nr:hypothetical protein [Tanacetum cinerariifolium]